MFLRLISTYLPNYTSHLRGVILPCIILLFHRLLGPLLIEGRQ
jgi:hypothetical protein